MILFLFLLLSFVNCFAMKEDKFNLDEDADNAKRLQFIQERQIAHTELKHKNFEEKKNDTIYNIAKVIYVLLDRENEMLSPGVFRVCLENLDTMRTDRYFAPLLTDQRKFFFENVALEIQNKLYANNASHMSKLAIELCDEAEKIFDEMRKKIESEMNPQGTINARGDVSPQRNYKRPGDIQEVATSTNTQNKQARK